MSSNAFARVEPLEQRMMMSAAPADSPPVYAPHSTVRGETLAQWSADWWKWAYSMPVSQNALFDTTGAQAFRGDVGKAFFLAGVIDVSGTATRNIELPSGTPVFFPVVNFEIDNAGIPPTTFSTQELRDQAAAFINGVNELHASVDGQAIPGLFSRREISPVFSYTLPANDNIAQFFGVNISGPVSGAVADGYYVMLKPLSPGQHTVNFGGANPSAGFSLDITYNIDVVPKGQYEKQFFADAGLAAVAAAANAGSDASTGDSHDRP